MSVIRQTLLTRARTDLETAGYTTEIVRLPPSLSRVVIGRIGPRRRTAFQEARRTAVAFPFLDEPVHVLARVLGRALEVRPAPDFIACYVPALMSVHVAFHVQGYSTRIETREVPDTGWDETKKREHANPKSFDHSLTIRVWRGESDISKSGP